MVADQTDAQLAFALVSDSPNLRYKALYRSPKNRESWEQLLPEFLPAPDEINLRYYLEPKDTITRFRLDPPAAWKNDPRAVWNDLKDAGVHANSHMLGLFQASTGEPYSGDGPALAVALPRHYVRQVGRMLDNAEVSLDRRHLLAGLPANLSYLTPVARQQERGGPVALVELRDDRCDLWIMGDQGLRLHRQTSSGLNDLVSRLQTELNLKFPGSAAKLVYEGLYDFSSTAETLTEDIGKRLGQDLLAAEEIIGEPVRNLAFTFLPPSADWMAQALAAHAGREVLQWPSAQGNAEPADEESNLPQCFIAPAVAGDLAKVERESETAWRWYLEDDESAFLVPADEAVATGKGMTRSTFVSIAGSSAEEEEEATMAADEDFDVADEGSPAPAEEKAAAAAAPAPATPSPAPAPKPAHRPSEAAPPAKKKSNPVPIIAAAVVLLLAGGGAFFALGGKDEGAKTVQAQPKLTPEQQKQADAEAKRKAEEEAQRQAEEEARRKEEEEARITAEAAALAEKMRAEEEAERKAAEEAAELERLAKQGSLTVTGLPEGTIIRVNGKEIGRNAIEDYAIDPGTYYVALENPDYETAVQEVTIDEKEDFALESPTMSHVEGQVVLNSQPRGATYTLYLQDDDTPVQEGATPATLNLAIGDYRVEFSRPGWESRSETFSIAKGNLKNIDTTFETGTIALTSEPTGADVRLNGEKVGVTPYTSTGMAPGIYRYQVHRPGYESEDISIELKEGGEVAQQLTLNDINRIYRASEIDVPPMPLYQPEPTIPAVSKMEEIMVEFVIDQQGQPTDVTIVKSTNEKLNKEILRALTEWRFQPAMRRDHPARIKVRLPLVFQPQATDETERWTATR